MPHNALKDITDEDLDRVLQPERSRARTLAVAAYTSPRVFAWELEHLFDHGWVCVGRSALVNDPGDQHAVTVGTRSVLLTRDEEGSLHAFHNSCRHRGHELLPPGASSNRRVVTCPYHSWAYCLDGALRVAPQFQHDASFEPNQWSLIRIRVEEWSGWVFLTFSEDAMPLAEWMAGLDDLTRAWAPSDLVVVATKQYELATNWKTIVENYAECYHCPSIHPQLCRVSPPESGEAYQHAGRWNGGRMALRDNAETMSLDGRSAVAPMGGLTTEQARHVHYFYVAPNLLVALHPDFVLTHRLVPRAAGSTEVECQWLYQPQVASRPGFDPSYAVDFWDVTNAQDFGACESVYRSMLSGGYRPGLFAEQELGSLGFQAQVASSYRAGRWTQARQATSTVSPRY